MTPQVHHRMRYRAAGTDWRTKRRTERLLTSRVPVRRPRAAATREDSSAISCGSGAAERTRDRDDPGRPGAKHGADGKADAAGKAAQECGIKSLEVRVQGPGPGRESSVRALAALGIRISSIQDVTPIPHNGCRPPKKRRI